MDVKTTRRDEALPRLKIFPILIKCKYTQKKMEN